jgi:hypothetical protein
MDLLPRNFHRLPAQPYRTSGLLASLGSAVLVVITLSDPGDNLPPFSASPLANSVFLPFGGASLVSANVFAVSISIPLSPMNGPADAMFGVKADVVDVSVPVTREPLLKAIWWPVSRTVSAVSFVCMDRRAFSLRKVYQSPFFKMQLA